MAHAQGGLRITSVINAGFGDVCNIKRFVSSDRSSCSDDGLLYICAQRQLFQIFSQSLDAIDVTSVTLSRLNSINAIDVT